MTRKNDRTDGATTGRGDQHRPRTAAEEVLAEFEDAETSVAGPEDHRHRVGESGDALSTSLEAQESAQEEEPGTGTARKPADRADSARGKED